MGRCFLDYLKDRERANNAFHQCIRLAMSTGRDFARVPWFARARTEVDAYKRRRLEAEEEENAKLESTLLASRKAECDLIEKAAKESCKALLEHIYEKHPAGPNRVLGSTAADDIARTLRNAVTHYHPDMHVKKTDAERAMFSFITKRLTPSMAMFSCC